MIFFKKIKHTAYYNIIIILFLNNCSFKEPYKNQGINFLENKYKIIEINKTNQNDAIKLIGIPHMYSMDNKNIWFYLEKQTTKGDFHKLGQNIVVKNNVLKLEFNSYGILSKKEFINKENMNKVNISKVETKNDLGKRSMVGDFLQSLKQKMYKK